MASKTLNWSGNNQNDIKDRRKVVAITYMMLGLAYRLPFNMASTATMFYTGFKLAYLSPSLENDTQLPRLAEYRGFFVNYLGIVMTAPILLATIINLVFMAETDNRSRILIVDGCLAFLNLSILILALLDSRSWPEVNYFANILFFLAMGLASGFSMSFVWASTADFQGFEVWIAVGHSIAGILPPLFSICAKLAASVPGSREFQSEPPSGFLNTALMYYMCSQVSSMSGWTSAWRSLPESQ